MIKYALRCDQAHDWEAWFDSMAGYETQVGRGLVECPLCGSKAVEKAPMAPAVLSSKSDRPTPPVPADAPVPIANGPDPLSLPEPVKAFFQGWKEHIEQNYDYVGDAFAKEVRAIHEGESEERLVYGQATAKEAKELIEDGISVAPLPALASPKPVRGYH